MSGDIFHQTRVLRAPSSLALSTAREGAATASLGSLGQGLTTLTVKKFADDWTNVGDICKAKLKVLRLQTWGFPQVTAGRSGTR